MDEVQWKGSDLRCQARNPIVIQIRFGIWGFFYMWNHVDLLWQVVCDLHTSVMRGFKAKLSPITVMMTSCVRFWKTIVVGYHHEIVSCWSDLDIFWKMIGRTFGPKQIALYCVHFSPSDMPPNPEIQRELEVIACECICLSCYMKYFKKFLTRWDVWTQIWVWGFLNCWYFNHAVKILGPEGVRGSSWNAYAEIARVIAKVSRRWLWTVCLFKEMKIN